MALFLEAFWNREAPMPLLRRLQSLLFMLIYTVASVIIGIGVVKVFGDMRFESLVEVPGPIGLVYAAIVGDFFYYWVHRVQHAFPILWKYHSVHHSIERMGAGTGYQHISQPLIESFILTIPASLLVDPAQAVALTVFIGPVGYYLHSTSRINAGPLRAILIDNHLHRIHHSREERHFDKNFGVLTSIWDRIFGTAYFPAKDEWPDTGVPGRREPRTIREFLLPSATVEPLPAFQMSVDARFCSEVAYRHPIRTQTEG
jgi:sterol desaturase/sphingolipid hydroxylase (fatty acid hydroxylase superfamily)